VITSKIERHSRSASAAHVNPGNCTGSSADGGFHPISDGESIFQVPNGTMSGRLLHFAVAAIHMHRPEELLEAEDTHRTGCCPGSAQGALVSVDVMRLSGSDDPPSLPVEHVRRGGPVCR